MQTLTSIDLANANAKSQQLLESFQQRRGRIPNMVRVMAHSPAILQAYLDFNHAFEQTRMTPKLRALIAVSLAQLMGCEYVLSIAAALGTREGITVEEFEAARKGESQDPKIAAALGFARHVIQQQGKASAEETNRLRKAGYDEEEIVEIIGAIVLMVFRNYFNLIVQTEVDYPPVKLDKPLQKSAA